MRTIRKATHNILKIQNKKNHLFKSIREPSHQLQPLRTISWREGKLTEISSTFCLPLFPLEYLPHFDSSLKAEELAKRQLVKRQRGSRAFSNCMRLRRQKCELLVGKPSRLEGPKSPRERRCRKLPSLITSSFLGNLVVLKLPRTEGQEVKQKVTKNHGSVWGSLMILWK